jgi:LytS/YehU family sensor histidine kinase
MNQTLPYFKEGLNRESAQQIAMIIKNLMKVSAVAHVFEQPSFAPLALMLK